MVRYRGISGQFTVRTYMKSALLGLNFYFSKPRCREICYTLQFCYVNDEVLRGRGEIGQSPSPFSSPHSCLIITQKKGNHIPLVKFLWLIKKVHPCGPLFFPFRGGKGHLWPPTLQTNKRKTLCLHLPPDNKRGNQVLPLFRYHGKETLLQS